MAGTFCPKVLVDTSAANWALFAATSAGGTVIANACS
jgi:hypothetical protein